MFALKIFFSHFHFCNKINAFNEKVVSFGHIFVLYFQVTATDGDVDRPMNIVYFLTGQGIDPDNPANSKFDINRTTGDIFVLKVSNCVQTVYTLAVKSLQQFC